MSLRRVVLPEAVEELLDAVAWYEERRAGLGAELFGVVDAGMVWVCSSPMAGAAWPDLPRYRRLVLQRFPDVLVYEVRGEEVEFVAVAHTRRKPGYWTDRIRTRRT